MTGQRNQIRIHARNEEVGRACQFVVALAAQAGLDSKAQHHCQLAIDEACTNIIEHGYGGSTPDQVIDVFCYQGPEQFDIVVVDDSPAFNPLQQNTPDPDTPLDERKMGGWGVYFIRKFMDHVTYEHRNGRNRLIMTKNLAPENPV